MPTLPSAALTAPVAPIATTLPLADGPALARRCGSGVGCPGSVPARAEVAIVSKIRVALFLSLVVALAVAVGCGSSDDDSSDDSTSASSVSLDDCTPDQLQTKADGTLTVATDKPAFPPYVIDDDPTNGKGFESAVAYAIADQLGFDQADVTWTRVPFNSSYAPGPKDFDFDVNQISITPKRERAGRLLEPVLRGRSGGRRPEGLRARRASPRSPTSRTRRSASRSEPRASTRSTRRFSRRASRRSSTPPTTSSRRSRTSRSTRSSSTLPTAIYLTAVQVPDGDRRRPVPGAGRRRVGCAAGEGVADHRLRLGGDRRAEVVRRARRRSRSSGSSKAVDAPVLQ